MGPFDAEYVPSAWEPIAAEVERYERSGGTEPSELVGSEWMILWTVGASSGKVRKRPMGGGVSVRPSGNATCGASAPRAASAIDSGTCTTARSAPG